MSDIKKRFENKIPSLRKKCHYLKFKTDIEMLLLNVGQWKRSWDMKVGFWWHRWWNELGSVIFCLKTRLVWNSTFRLPLKFYQMPISLARFLRLWRNKLYCQSFALYLSGIMIPGILQNYVCRITSLMPWRRNEKTLRAFFTFQKSISLI